MTINSLENTTSNKNIEIYRKLAGMIGVGNSERIAHLWSMLCSEDEAVLLTALPNTSEKLAEKTNRSKEEIIVMLNELFRKGAVFERIKDGVVTYNLPKSLIQFHDASVLWPGAALEFLDMWKEFMDEEYPSFLKMIESAGLGPFMRVIPINRAIEGGSEILHYEHAARMIKEAQVLAVTDCTCRKTQRRCDAPLDVCLQLDRGAEYAIKRGTGRAITKEEALAILDKAENAGLVHLSENRAKIGNVLCNCCTCCCMALQPMLRGGIKVFAAPSRYLSIIEAGVCSGCFLCKKICPACAISENDSIAIVNNDMCIGCGLCISVCASDAISLKEIRQREFIP